MTISQSTSIHLTAIPQTLYLQNRPLYILHRCRLGFPGMYFSFNSTVGSWTLNLGFILKDFDLKDSLQKSSLIPADIPQSRTLHFSGGLPLCKWVCFWDGTYSYNCSGLNISGRQRLIFSMIKTQHMFNSQQIFVEYKKWMVVSHPVSTQIWAHLPVFNQLIGCLAFSSIRDNVGSGFWYYTIYIY